MQNEGNSAQYKLPSKPYLPLVGTKGVTQISGLCGQVSDLSLHDILFQSINKELTY